MQTEPSSPNHSLRAAEDPFWAALFAQEESNFSPIVTAEPNPTCNTYGHEEDYSAFAEESDFEEDAWLVAQEIFNADETIELQVTGYNKGGLLVSWRGLQGFIPASQLIDFPQFHQESERINALQQWQNKRLSVKIIEVDEDHRRFILSERASLVKAQERERLFRKMTSGDHVSGTVTNLTNFGTFVDLGGVEGLIHISELSWSRVSHPSEVVQPGQQVTVLVLTVDEQNGRIALSLKRLKADPWQTVQLRFKPGQMVEGIISKVVNYGAFVQIEDELEGLIHISELAEGTFLHPRNVVRQGQSVKARVLYVDGADKRLALSLRGVSG